MDTILKRMITLIETEYPNEDINDCQIVCKLINENFGTDFTVNDIMNHYIISLDEHELKIAKGELKNLNDPDMQYNTVNIPITCIGNGVISNIDGSAYNINRPNLVGRGLYISASLQVELEMSGNSTLILFKNR